MRIGPERHYEFKRKLYDHVDNFGPGVAGMYDWPIPDECFDFVESQFKRFNIPIDPSLFRLTEAAARSVWYFVDAHDPYALLLAFSDIGLTDEWQKFTYEVRGRNNVPVECDPEEIESFRYLPGQAEHWFNYFLSNPGLEAIPYLVGEGIDSELDHLVDEPLENFGSEWESIYALVGDKYRSYLQLCAWASFIWLAGPLGRDYRMSGHDLFDACITYGEAIICDGCIMAPRDYRKIPRPPQSCYKCSLDSWCTELVEVEGVTRYVCEYCLNNGMILYPGANCGSRVCKHVECPRHVHHSQDRVAGLFQTFRSNGQLLPQAQGVLIA